MTIDRRCREQQLVANEILMDFKHTKPGSQEQFRSLKTLSFLIGMWSNFFRREETRMNAALALEENS